MLEIKLNPAVFFLKLHFDCHSPRQGVSEARGKKYVLHTGIRSAPENVHEEPGAAVLPGDHS